MLKSSEEKTPVSGQDDGSVVNKTSSQDGTADSSTLLGDKYVDNELDQDRMQDKIKVVKEDIDNVRLKLKKKEIHNNTRKNENPDKSNRQQDRLSPPRRGKEDVGIPEDDEFERELIEVQTDSYSLPTCFEPKNNADDTVISRWNKNKSSSKPWRGKRDSSLPRSQPNDSSQHDRAVAGQSHSERRKQDLDIVQAAERAEQRVREGLEKMKKGLADNKRVKLSIEKHRKKQASDSPKPKKTNSSMFGLLSSWLPR